MKSDEGKKQLNPLKFSEWLQNLRFYLKNGKYDEYDKVRSLKFSCNSIMEFYLNINRRIFLYSKI